ncbi:hypothetical protein L596_026504 [Steinernema carpocapsae]|uniref:G-protein coupled receptors family 1 profile domain-containing protein n=1 Tax=Steinernema carpocapsae TaxID=34508 RepID=A0A4U5M1M6_STECR|nr:hypothetical protein L596_026504 [Steinernema carpocapsae]
MMNGVGDDYRLFLIVFRLVLLGVFVPLYGVLLMVLVTHKQFYSVIAYNIMVQLGVVDIMCLCTVGLAAVMNIEKQNFPVASKVAIYFRCLYFVALFSFSFLLALNRLLVFNLAEALKRAYYLFLSTVIWTLVLIVLPVCLYYDPTTESEYDLDYGMYLTDGYVAQQVIRGLEIVFYVATIVLYVSIVVLIIVKRIRFKLKVKLSSPETRILLQAFLLFSPPVTVFTLSMIMFSFNFTGMSLWANTSVVMLTTTLFDLLPVINLIVQVAFNT